MTQEAIKMPEWALHFTNEKAPESFNFESKSIQSYLDEAAEKFPKRKAVIFKNLKISYEQLKKKAEIMAASLKKQGLQTGDRVGIMLPNLPQTIISIWAVLKAGGIVVMVNPLYMEREIVHNLNDSQVKFLIALDMFWDKIKILREKLPVQKYFITTVSDALAFPLNFLYNLREKRNKSKKVVDYSSNVLKFKKFFTSSERYNEYPKNPDKAIALLQYTGGTTGLSKAAMLTHGNISAHLQQLHYVHKQDDSKEILSVAVMPFFHIFGLTGTVFMPAHLASPTLPVPSYVPRDILELIKKYRPALFIGAPSVYIGLMQQKDIANYDLTCIDLCIVGASPFPVDSLRKFTELTKANITEGYGLTECSPCVSANPVFGLKKPGSVGVSFPGTEIKIVDLENGTKEMPMHEMGEVIIKGPQVMPGYWERDEENAYTLRDGWFFTGDIAYRDEDGYIFIVDRKKDMAIIGGYNVYPREIDEVLIEHPKVQDAVSLAVDDKSRGQKLKAYIVPKPGMEISVPELVAFCKEKLANYKVPKVFEVREELPKSILGKVLRRVLRDEEDAKLKEEKTSPSVEVDDVKDNLENTQQKNVEAENEKEEKKD